MSNPIVIAGGSGFIGRRLAAQLAADGDPVVILTRQSAKQVGPVEFVHWDASGPGDWQDRLENAAAVINLCGETIAGPRWSDARKQTLTDSRVIPTQALLSACAQCSAPPGRFLQASGVGYYGTGDAACTEQSSSGSDFLAQLAVAWEAPLKDIPVSGMPVTALRLGVVLGRKGGALPQMMLPFRMFMGGPMGSGLQWLSWIHLDDVIAAIAFLLRTEALSASYNLTAPEPIRNHQLADAAAAALKRPNWVPMPRTVMNLLLGEQATLVCDGQQALPQLLQSEGFQFQFPDITTALNNLLH